MTLLLAAFSPVHAADLSAYVVLTTDYVWRGVTQSDEDPAAQLGGEIALESGLYGGVWASTIDIDNGPGRERDTEMRYYLGYGWDATNTLTLTANVVAYRYPGQGGLVDYAYEEYMLTGNYDDRLWITYAFSPDLYHSGYESHNVETFAEVGLGKHLILGAGIGYYDVAKLAGDDYAYWELGVTWPVNRIDIDLRYHDTSRWVPIVSSADRAGARVALSFRISI